MRHILILALVLGVWGSSAHATDITERDCITTKDGGAPFPLGARAPLPWDVMNGYWTHWNNEKFSYRFEVIEVTDEGSRTVTVAMLDQAGKNIVARGYGVVRANSKELRARVIGADTDLRITLAAYLPKNSTDISKRALVATLKDMRPESTVTCVVRHMVIRTDDLKGKP